MANSFYVPGYMDNYPDFQPPYTSEQIRSINSAYNPAGIRSTQAYTVRYFERQLCQRIMYFLDISGAPPYWDMLYLKYCLMWCGYCGVMDYTPVGAIPQWGTLSGWGIYCQPTRYSVVNRFIDRPLMRIGEDCEVIRMTPDYRGIMDTVTFYAIKLALVSRDFDTSAISSTVSWAVAAKTKAAAMTIKALFDKAQAGEVLAVYDPAALLPNEAEYAQEPWQTFSRDVREGFILKECLDVMESLYHQFDTDMGIPNANTQKRERMVVEEVTRNDGETESRVLQFVEEINRSLDKVNAMFGLNLRANLRGEGSENASDIDAE